jgi:hypothetical protein
VNDSYQQIYVIAHIICNHPLLTSRLLLGQPPYKPVTELLCFLYGPHVFTQYIIITSTDQELTDRAGVR